MAERPPGDRPPPSGDGEEQYGWLYGSRPRPDPEATQAMPRRPASNSAADPDATHTMPPPSKREPAGPDAEQTQFLPSWQQRAPRTDATRREGTAAPAPTGSRTGSEVPPPHLPPPNLPPPNLPPPNLPPPNLPPPTARPTRAASGRPPKRRRWWLRVILGLLLLWLVFLVAVPIWAWSKIDKVDAEPSGDRPSDQPGTTYLIVGSDSREGLSTEEREELSTGGDAGGGRTDTIMLLHTGDGAPLLLSVPRDSLVDVPGYGNTKINAAFAYGGPPLLVKTLEQETGIRIDDYVEIGFGGFVNVVDAVGGVEICSEQEITDPKAGLTDDNAIQEGCQQVGGIQALGFARSRQTFSTSDIQRVQNQREVISAIGDKAASPWSLINPVRYFKLADAGASSLSVGDNVGPLSLARFAWALAHVSGGGGQTCTVPISDLAVHWDPERAPQLFELIAEDRTDDIPKSLCTQDGLAR